MHAGHVSDQQRTDRNRHRGPRRQVAKFRRPALSQCPLSLFQNVPSITTRKPLTWACLCCSCITKKNRRSAVTIEHDEPLLLSLCFSQNGTIHDGSVASGDRPEAAGTGRGDRPRTPALDPRATWPERRRARPGCRTTSLRSAERLADNLNSALDPQSSAQLRRDSDEARAIPPRRSSPRTSERVEHRRRYHRTGPDRWSHGWRRRYPPDPYRFRLFPTDLARPMALAHQPTSERPNIPTSPQMTHSHTDSTGPTTISAWPTISERSTRRRACRRVNQRTPDPHFEHRSRIRRANAPGTVTAATQKETAPRPHPASSP